MGYYYGPIKLEFEGTDKEKRMMEKLLQLMEPDSDEEEWRLPVSTDIEGMTTALLGTLLWNDEGPYLTLGTIDPLLAPKLFAALFPESRFRYDITMEYSVSSEDTPYYTAIFEDHTLRIRHAILYPSDTKEIESICRSLLESDPDASKKVKRHRKEFGLNEKEENVWYGLLDDLVDNREEIVASLYEFYEVPPAIDEEYIKSFFDGDDLLAYLEGQ